MAKLQEKVSCCGLLFISQLAILSSNTAFKIKTKKGLLL